MGRMLVWADSIPARLAHPKAKVITVAKGLCTPARGDILTLLKPYGNGARVLHITDRLEQHVFTNDDLYWIADVFCQPNQVKWIEYLLLSSGMFRLMSRPHDPGNLVWTANRRGNMPTPWSATAEPWREPTCKKKEEEKRGRT